MVFTRRAENGPATHIILKEEIIKERKESFASAVQTTDEGNGTFHCFASTQTLQNSRFITITHLLKEVSHLTTGQRLVEDATPSLPFKGAPGTSKTRNSIVRMGNAKQESR